MTATAHDTRKPSGGTGRGRTEIGPTTVARSLKELVVGLGELARFSGSVLRAVPGVRRYPTELLRQVGILVSSSALIIWFMCAVGGMVSGLQSSYLSIQIGAASVVGLPTSFAVVRGLGPLLWGYIVAAKVGCGLTAEIGSMRITDELDALEVNGIRTMSYIVATRVVAAWIATPLLFTIALGIMAFTAWALPVKQLAIVSTGGFSTIFWGFQNPYDLFAATMIVIAMTTAIVLVGCYYGFTASGGPVGVGRNTAKSMIMSLILVHIVAGLGSQLFWGLNPNIPIAN